MHANICRSYDIDMIAAFNSQEREVGEWKALLAEADKRFILKGVIEPKGSTLAILEVVWDASS